MGQYAFGVDIGGTNIVTGLVGENGQVIWKKKFATEPENGNEHVMQQIAAAIAEGIAASQVQRQLIKGVGVGMPGIVDAKQGISVYSANLHFRNYNVAERLQRLTGMPVWLDNDVRMYVYGEAVYGAGKEEQYVLGLTLGTGLAAAFVQNGELYRGGAGLAGELGHVPADGVSYRCNCGMTGCLETVVSATGIAKQARIAVLAGEKTVLAGYHDDPQKLTAADVSRAYDEGDLTAVSIMNRTGSLLGRSLAHVVSMLSPDIVVIGGGVAGAGERLLKPVRNVLRQNTLPFYRDRVKIETAQFIDDAGIIGSAGYAFKQAKLEEV